MILGGGSGKILKHLTHVKCIIFIEKSSKMIKLAKASARGNVQFICADFSEYSIENESINVVICPFFLDLFSAIQLEEVLNKILRILKKNGSFFVADFKYTTWWSKRLIKLMYTFFGIVARIPARELLPLDTLILAKQFENSTYLPRTDGIIFSKMYIKK